MFIWASDIEFHLFPLFKPLKTNISAHWDSIFDPSATTKQLFYHPTPIFSVPPTLSETIFQAEVLIDKGM